MSCLSWRCVGYFVPAVNGGYKPGILGLIFEEVLSLLPSFSPSLLPSLPSFHISHLSLSLSADLPKASVLSRSLSRSLSLFVF